MARDFSRSLAAYSLLLRVLPLHFRNHHGCEMVTVFSEALEAAGGSFVGVTTAWIAAVRDILHAAVYTRTLRPSGREPNRKDTPSMFSLIIRDIRIALRSLRKAPGFSFVAVTTIGLGIGATTLVFSAVFGVLLNPLPYRDSDRLVNVWNDLVNENQYLPAVSPADFRDYQEMSQTFEQFAAASGAGQVGLSGVLTGDGPPQLVDLSPVTHNFFSLLGVDPILGRNFTEEEEQFNGPRVTMISHQLWQSRFGSDGDIIGRSIDIDGNPFEVVGVLPRGFELLLPAEAFLVKPSDVWVPLQIDYSQVPPRNWTYFTVLGKLRPGVGLEEAQVEMNAIADRLTELHAEHQGSGMKIRLVPFQSDIVKEARPVLLTLFGAVGFVLLIACTNVAHLMLLRGGTREREMAVRIALGAGRGSMARQIMTESMVVSVAGTALGLILSWVGLSFLVAFQAQDIPRLAELSLNTPVLLFAVFAAVATALVFGFAPAVQASRSDVNSLIKEGGRTGQSRGAARLRQALVIGEIALSMVLLVGTGLMLKSFSSLSDVRPGFDSEGVLTFSVSLPRGRYDRRAAAAFFTELESNLASVPGVVSAGSISQLPLTGSGSLWPYAYDAATSEEFNLSADGRVVSNGFFESLGIRIVDGRSFAAQDASSNAPLVIIEEMLAQRAWPGESAVGKQLELGGRGNFATVIGVAEHSRIYDLKEDIREQVFVSVGQRPPMGMKFTLKTAGIDALSITGLVRDEVWAIDDALPVTDMRLMSDYVDDALAPTRLAMILMSGFGGLALLLASIGIYGVISYSVDIRKREFGVRVALGENPEGLLRSVLSRSFRMVILSLVLGVLASIALARFVEGLLFGVGAADPANFLVFGGVLFVSAMAASFVPARRAMRANPVDVLRSE